MGTGALVLREDLQGPISLAQQQQVQPHATRHTQSSDANKPTSSLKGKQSSEEKPNCAGKPPTGDSSNHCWDHCGQVPTSLTLLE